MLTPEYEASLNVLTPDYDANLKLPEIAKRNCPKTRLYYFPKFRTMHWRP